MYRVEVELYFTNKQYEAMEKAVKEMQKRTGKKTYNVADEIEQLAKIGMKHAKLYGGGKKKGDVQSEQRSNT